MAESVVYRKEALPRLYRDRIKQKITRSLDDYLSEQGYIVYLEPMWGNLQRRMTALETHLHTCDAKQAEHYKRVLRVMFSDYSALNSITSRV
jgi:hypothetical protein